MSIVLQAGDWLNLFTHFMTLSLLAVGGAIITAPEMHRYLVDENHWLSDAQFASSIAIAQAAPGPNVLFIAVLGWNLGMNAATDVVAGTSSWWIALAGSLLAMLGSLLPSTTLTYFAAQWGHRNRELRAVKAFKCGFAPIVIALLITTGWLLISAHDTASKDWPLWLLTVGAALVVWRTRIHLLIVIMVGATLGALGFV